jgi:hypothetical protein
LLGTTDTPATICRAIDPLPKNDFILSESGPGIAPAGDHHHLIEAMDRAALAHRSVLTWA